MIRLRLEKGHQNCEHKHLARIDKWLLIHLLHMLLSLKTKAGKGREILIASVARILSYRLEKK
jgi:hypothetical protein